MEFEDIILSFFEFGNLSKQLNMTCVTLIPKFEGSYEVKDFRPISMIGCIYKVIAKIMANRLKMVMAKLVGEAQSMFEQNRHILDGVLIACKVVH